MAGVGQTLLVTWGVRGLHVNAYATVCCRLASWHGIGATAAAAGALCPGVSHGTLQTDDLVPVCVCLLFIHWVRAAGAGAPILITTSLQVDDLALLKAYKKKRAVRLPLSAQNKKQWDEELRLTDRDARRLERAQAWAAAEHR